jgi:hypothetical protein
MVEAIRPEQLSRSPVRQDQLARKDQLSVPLFFPHHLCGIFTREFLIFHHDFLTVDNCDPDEPANMQLRSRRVKSSAETEESRTGA